jgi:hypothetical protein
MTCAGLYFQQIIDMHLHGGINCGVRLQHFLEAEQRMVRATRSDRHIFFCLYIVHRSGNQLINYSFRKVAQPTFSAQANAGSRVCTPGSGYSISNTINTQSVIPEPALMACGSAWVYIRACRTSPVLWFGHPRHGRPVHKTQRLV